MYITPEILKDYFADMSIQLTILGNVRKKYRDVRFYREGEAADDDFLYIITKEEFELAPQYAAHVLVPHGEHLQAVGGYSLLTAPVGRDELFNLVRACFVQYTEQFESLYRLIALGASIETVLESAFPLVKNPIFIDDSSYRTLARLKDYPTEGFKDNEYIFMQQSGHHSADYIYAMLNGNVAVESSAISPRPIIHRFEFLAHRTLYSTIKVDGEIVGFFSCIEVATTFTPGMMDVVEALTELWSVALARQATQSKSRQKSLDNDLFLGILNGSIADAELTKTAFSQLGLQEGRYVVAYTVTDVNTKANPVLLPRIMELIMTNIENSFAFADGSNIVLILNRAYDEELREDLVRMIGFYLGEFHVTIGLSLEFSNPEKLPLFFQQAVASARLGPLAIADPETQAPRYFLYNEVVGYDVLERFGDREARMAICHPAVFILLQHDREKKMNLLATLKVFTDCFGDTGLAAERLYLHRNSLYYRLKQIVALTGVDLADEFTLSHIMLSMRILQINGDFML
ncbi:MAG: helix-turn-helix domain-containing protein [Clostridiales bacterium]|nr:helix-turn-helix domain-containing protein [Clostridiales bacterium]